MALKRKRVTTDDLLRMQEQGGSNGFGLSRMPSQNEDESDEEEVANAFAVDEQTVLSRFGTRPTEEDLTKRNTVPDDISKSRLKPDFTALGISSNLVQALAAMSIKLPTEIQIACIPPLLAGRDCIGNAQTGSGKTIAFALPILQSLSRDPYGIFALVLTPTRELAFQITEQFNVLGFPLNIRTATTVGGMDMVSQALELKNFPHVVVATPGRLVDHLKSSNGEINLSRIKFLVLDEADRLLTPTFAPELAYLFSIIPRERQTALFTATLTPSVEKLAEAPVRPGKEKPFIHRMTERVETVTTLNQYYILSPSHVREIYLYYLLIHPPESVKHLRRVPPEPVSKSKSKSKSTKSSTSQKAKTTTSDNPSEILQPPPTIIFAPTARLASYITFLLQNLRIRSTALHSRLSQRQRLQSLSLFRSSTIPVLVTTDVGARGLDIEDVALVVNWDVPLEPETYTHRVGRTARAGRSGVSVTFVGGEEAGVRVTRIEGRINTKLEEMKLPEDKVLESLNLVSTAKRLANMELHDSDFGKREEIHQIKKQKRHEQLERDNGDADAGKDLHALM